MFSRIFLSMYFIFKLHFKKYIVCGQNILGLILSGVGEGGINKISYIAHTSELACHN